MYAIVLTDMSILTFEFVRGELVLIRKFFLFCMSVLTVACICFSTSSAALAAGSTTTTFIYATSLSANYFKVSGSGSGSMTYTIYRDDGSGNIVTSPQNTGSSVVNQIHYVDSLGTSVNINGIVKLVLVYDPSLVTIDHVTWYAAYTDAVVATTPISSGTTTSAPPPAKVSTVNMVSRTDKSISMNWNAVSGADLYKLYLNGSPAGSVSGTTFTFAGLSGSTTYTVQVSAVSNAGGESALSDPISVTTLPTPVIPVAPTGLSGTGKNNYVDLVWSAVSNATTYNVYRDGALIASKVTSLSYHDATSIKAGTLYTYTVTAVNAAGESPKSAAVGVTPVLVVTPISNLELQPGKTQLMSQWLGTDAPYTVSWSSSSSPSKSFQTSNNSYLISGLSAMTDYTVTVTDKSGVVVSQTLNTGNVQAILNPPMPEHESLVQKMLDALGTAGSYLLYIILAAVALGVIVVLGIWAWRRAKQWLRAAKK